MRILYIDIDSLRPDHLGCYGYHRNTSPHIDSVAKDGVRFENCFVSDAPCAPSRTALFSGRFGFQNGLVGHGGTAGQPFVEGPTRSFNDIFGRTSWMTALRRAGLRTVTVSPFGERHGVWHWYAGFNEIYNCGNTCPPAHVAAPYALDWLERNAASDNWFLHVNFWDPHTPYQTPLEFGHPFANDPLPEWLTEEVWRRSWEGFGPHSPQEPHGFDDVSTDRWPRFPRQIDSMDAVRAWIDGYDTGIRYADHYVGQLLEKLKEAGVYDDTAIIISSDHGENQGELNVWGDHQTADSVTTRVPLIIRWPGISGGRVDRALHYHFDWAATVIELAGGTVPANWDGKAFTKAFQKGAEEGRPFIVTSQGAWSCQRGVFFEHQGTMYECLRTYHDGYKMLEPIMLFDLGRDPHKQRDLSVEQPEIVNLAMRYLNEWLSEMAQKSPSDTDPLMTVMREGGPFHTRGRLPAYLERLRQTGRAHHAERLAAIHAREL